MSCNCSVCKKCQEKINQIGDLVDMKSESISNLLGALDETLTMFSLKVDKHDVINNHYINQMRKLHNLMKD